MARIEYSLKATHAQTRAHNASLVLRALYDLGPISRADIARLTGLTRTSVGELVADLEAEGLAREVGRGPSTGGKQPDPRRPRQRRPHRRSSSTSASARSRPRSRTSAASSTDRRTRDLDGRDGDDALALVHELIDEVSREATSPILGIGVGTPGIVDAGGTIRWAVNLDWKDLPLADLLHDRYGLPTVVANDARAAALATYLFEGEDRPTQPHRDQGRARHRRRPGPRRRARSAATATAPARSATSSSSPMAPQCHCGRFGCLETVASATAILRAATARRTPADDHPRPSWPPRPRAATSARWPSTRAAGRALGAAIANLIGTLDVRHIVGPRLRRRPSASRGSTAIRDEATRRSLGPLARETRIIDGGSGEDLTLLGACALLLTSELGLTVQR